MVKSYLVVSLALLAIVPFLVLDVDAQSTTLLTVTRDKPDPEDKVIGIRSDNNNNTAFLNNNNSTFRSGSSPALGEIHILGSTRILANPIFATLNNAECESIFRDVKYLLTRNNVPNLAVPDNIAPQGNDNITAVGFNVYPDTPPGSSFEFDEQCSPDLEATSTQPIITNQEMLITIYGKHDKMPYYFSPRDNILQAQPITPCTNTNYDRNTKTMKGTTEMCYGKDGTHMTIMTKRLLGFYGAADSISTTTVDPISRDNVNGVGSYTTARFNITTIGAGTGSIDAAGKYTYSGTLSISDSPTPSGHIYIPPSTIISSSAFVVADAGKVCAQGLVIPSDFGSVASNTVFLPDGVSNITAYGFGASNGLVPCIMTSIGLSQQQRDVDKVLQVVLYDQAGKHGYSYDREQNITTAQYIAPCDTTNFNNATKDLRNNVKMCYADVGTDLVVYTKVMQFYGANETPLDPPTPGTTDPPGTVTPDPNGLLTIPEPDNMPAAQDVAMSIAKEPHELYWYFTSEFDITYRVSKIGTIFVQGNWTELELNPFLTNSTKRVQCVGSYASLKYSFVDNFFKDFTIPDNITPKNKKKLFGFGIDWTKQKSTANVNCHVNLEAPYNHPLIMKKELRITLFNQSDKTPYYFSPIENIPQAQPIPLCTSDNFDITDQTLKGDTKMCYGKNNNDMIIITKRLAGFYGAADKVIVPIAPPSTATPQYLTLMINSRSDSTTGYFSSSGSYTHSSSNTTGDIYIPPNTKVLSNPVLYDSVSSCTLAVNTLKDIPPKRIQDLKVPGNMKPKQKDKTIAIGFDLYLGNKVKQKCSPDLEEPSIYPLLTDKPLRFTLYNQSDKKPYYFSPRDDIKRAQPVPECSSTNYDFTAQTLKGDTKMCYGVNGDHLVIMTKRLLGFYGAADRVNKPGPIDLDTAGSPILDRVFVLTPPDNFPDPVFTSTTVVSDAGVKTGYVTTSSSDGHTFTHSNILADRIGSIFIPSEPSIPTSNVFTTAASECTLFPVDIKAALNNNYVPGLAIPDNIKPNTTNSLAALGFDMYNGSGKSVQCSPDLESNNNTAPLLLDKELRFTLFGKYDKTPYYISPRDNITAAQSIPACTSTTIHLSNQSLQKGTFMCYGTYDDHIVIITKRLSGFYGAADTVNGNSANASPDMDEIRSRDNIKGIGTQVPFRITTEAAGKATIEVSGKYTYSPAGTTQMGHIYIPPSTTISNDLFVAADKGKACVLGYVLSSEYTPSTNAELFTLPDDVSDGIAYGFGYSANTLDNPTGCNLNGNTEVDPPLDVDTVLQIVLYNQANKQGYSYLRTDNINTSQYVPPCNAGNFDSTTKTLIGDTKHCYTNAGDDLLVYTTIMQWYGAKPFDDDGMSTAPTFGTSPLTGEQLVTCGYKMDDTCRDITAYHVQYERDVIQTNTTHTFALKALAPNMIDSFTLAFGVPDIGSPISAAEAYITAKLAVNYTSPSYYNIVQVTVHDPNNIIDYDIADTEIARVSCSGGTLECAQVTFPDVLFRETLYHEPFVVMITDTLLYTSINYMNEGILVTGAPLNEQPTVQPGITVDTGDIRPTKLVLVRTDKVNDLWADAFGNTWSRNSFGNYVIVQYAPYAGTVPVCDDINDRLCAPFKAKLDWHNQRMIELRDSLYTAYTTKAYAEIDDIFTYEFGDMDSRTRTLINLGWLTE